MKVLFIILAVSVVALLANVVVLWVRVRWQLRRSNEALKNALAGIDAEREPADKT
jgi:hypothetical protein